MTARQAILAAMPGTIAEIMGRTDRSRTAIRLHLAELKAAKNLHISAWSRSNKGHAVAVYSPGRQANAPMPARPDRVRKVKAPAIVEPAVAFRSVPMVPAALLAQSRVFPLAGVWA